MKTTAVDTKSANQTYRVFVAIEVPAEIRRRIGAYVNQLRGKFPDVRASWSREDNLHLTLKFLGDVEVSRTEALSQACTRAVHRVNPFELEINGCGTFPPHGKTKVLWIGVRYAGVPPVASKEPQASGKENPEAGEDLLLSLHAAIEASCAAAGFVPEPRPYHPHLTIARLREPRASRALAEHHQQSDFASTAFTVSEVVLFRSELSSKGSKYTPLSHFSLG